MADTSAPDISFSNDPLAEGNPYTVLHLDRNADRSTIKSAYRALQRKARRGDELWMKVQQANEALTKPHKRLVVDLFVVYERKLYAEIEKRYGDVSFELVPDDPTQLFLAASALQWGDVSDLFDVPQVPDVEFEPMVPDVPKHDVVFLVGRRK